MKEFRRFSKTQYVRIYQLKTCNIFISDKGEIVSVPYNQKTLRLNWKNQRKRRLVLKRVHEYPGEVLAFTFKGQTFAVKELVIARFTPYNVSSYQIQHKNGNPKDCSLSNLVIYEGKEADHLKVNKKVRVRATMANGEIRECYSLAELADSIPCDRRTLYDFVNKKHKTSILDDIIKSIERKFCYDNR